MIYSLFFFQSNQEKSMSCVQIWPNLCPAFHSTTQAPELPFPNKVSPSLALSPFLPPSVSGRHGPTHTHTHIFRPHFPFTLCCPSYLPYTFVLTLPTFFISPLLVPSPLFLTLSWLSSLFPCPSVSASPSRLCVLVRSHTPRGIFHPIYHIHSLPLLLD